MASIALQVRIDTSQIKYVAAQLGNMRQTKQVFASAINRALKPTRKFIIDEIADVTKIKDKSRIAKRFERTDIDLAKPSKLSGMIRVKGRPLAAINFPGSHKGIVGAAFLPRPGEVMLFRHGFVGVGLAGKGFNNTKGNKHLWIRKLNTKHYVRRAHHAPNIYRLMDEIRPLYGPRVETVYRRNPSIRQRAEEMAQAILRKRIASGIDRFLKPQQAKADSASGDD